MAVGTIQRSVLTDIANAIRVQNGGTDTYLPSEMAAAVLALDGTKSGTPYQAPATSGTGVISDSSSTASRAPSARRTGSPRRTRRVRWRRPSWRSHGTWA